LIPRLPAWIRTFWQYVKWPAVIAGVFLAVLLAPVAYVELACRGTTGDDTYRPTISEPAFVRREANTYLTYPEWHIVYAYDGLAEAVKTGDEHAFDYVNSVRGFWRSTCALMEVADAHGGADFDTRSMIHTIGVSFAAEMALKAVYEETVGRLTAWLRGPNKSGQDRAIAAMSIDYAAFLRQTPWYRYPFLREARALWSTPAGFSLRGWERRIGIGTEFVAKAAYAKVIERAAAAAPAQLVIRSIVGGIGTEELRTIPDVNVIGSGDGRAEIETPRYDVFTRILADIARRGGTITEIAGNDDVMVTITTPEGAGAPTHGRVILRMTRDGFPSERLLIDLKVTALASLIRDIPLGDPGLEHVFDY
jgi:hypothetical protein